MEFRGLMEKGNHISIPNFIDKLLDTHVKAPTDNSRSKSALCLFRPYSKRPLAGKQ